jgi:Glycosyl hydrolase family 26
VITLAAAAPAAADDPLLRPPGNETFFGVTDTGDVPGFTSFADAIGKHPPVIETFHPWGNSLHTAIPRWGTVAARPILAISTSDPNDGHEIITPRGIATAGDDDYLIRLNSSFATRNLKAYIRPLGEVNRCLNAWAAYDCAGHSRGDAYSPGWYKQAFRRMYIILHGGGSLAQIDARLAAVNLPPLNRKKKKGAEPDSLPAAPVVLIWSPLPGGSPATRNNKPGHFYPGDQYVDWIGTDFYSQYPYWRTLKHFYDKYRTHKKPFVLSEWGVSNGDDPKFVKQIFAFRQHHIRCRMLVYYQDFGTSNRYRIQNYPKSRAVLGHLLQGGGFPTFAPEPPPPPPPGTPTSRILPSG